RISFGAVNTANASTAGNTININVFKVAGNHGNIQINGTGGFHGFTNTTTPALLFGGTTTTVNLDIEGSFLLNNTLNAGVNLFSAGSGSGNAFNLTVDGDMLVRANLTFNGSIGNNAVFTGTCNNLTQTGAAFTFSSIGGTATGSTTTLNTIGDIAFGGGNFNFLSNSATSTTNIPALNIGGSLSVLGATVHFYPSTVDNLSANINITGGLNTSGGTITTSGSPVATRRCTITFVGGSNHVWNGVVAGSRLALGSTIDFTVPTTNTLQITNSQLITGNLLVDGSLEFPTSPAVTFTLNGNLTGTGNIKMNGAPHSLVLSGTGSQSIDSIYTNNGGSAVVYNSGSTMNVIPLYYENLRFAGNGQKVITGEVIVNKDFNMVAGTAVMGNTNSLFRVIGNSYLNTTSFSFGAAAAHNVVFNGLVNGGTISMPTSAQANNLTFGGEAYGVALSVSNNTTGTVIYNALGKQNILAGTYANLTIDGSGLKNGNNGAITVNGKLSLKGGAFVAQLNGDITNRAANTALNLGVGAQIEVDGGTLSSAPRLAVSTSTYSVSYLRSAVSGAELRPVVGVLSGLNISGNTVVTLDSAVTIGAVAINGSINFGTDEGVLDLGAHDLTIFRTSAGAFSGTIGAANGKILTNGVGRLILMGGTTRANYNQTYPLATGIAGAYSYSPVIMNFSAGNISSAGLNLRAVGQRHPLSAANIANKYFEVRTTGIWTNVTGSLTLGYTQSEVNGTQSSYVGRFLNTSNGSNWGVNSATLSNGGSTPNFTTSFNYTNSSNIAGTYTFGEAASFPSSILWSKTSGNWTTSGTFVSGGYLGSTNEVPTATSYVVIGNNRTVTANSNNLQVAGLLLEPTGTLELGYTEGHNFGKVSGNGTLSYVLDSVYSENPIFPSGDFSDFFSEQGNGTVAFGGVGTYSLPAGITTYNNINVFGGGTKQGPGSAFTIRRQLNLGVSGGANTAFSIANDVYFTGGGLNVINIANNFTGTINHITGTAFFNGNGNHTFNSGNTEQFYNMRGISVGTNAILVLRNGNTGNQFNLSGNITLNTIKGAGLVTD
ncbi:MAG: beta strand repeat-containing protein, partial [Flexibacteraceae bacterium]